MLMEPLLLLLLVILLLVVGAGALISLLLRALFPSRPPAPPVAASRLNPNLAYQPRPRVLNPSEQALLEGLAQVLAPDDYRVLTQVPLARLVAPDWAGSASNDQTDAEAVLRRYFLDSVICRASDSRPRCALVFDTSVCAREPAVAHILSSAGLGLVSVPVQARYPRELLEAALNGRVNLEGAETVAPEAVSPEKTREPPPDSQREVALLEPEPEMPEHDPAPAMPQSVDGKPLCPRCYAPMQRRDGRDGGNAVWRCSRYPRCPTEVEAPPRHSHDAV